MPDFTSFFVTIRLPKPFDQESSLILVGMVSSVRRFFRRAVTVILVIAVIGGGVFAWINRVEIATRIDAMGYDATPAMTKLESRLELTTRGEYLFRASHPTLDGSSKFSHKCAGVDQSEKGHLLGCFTPQQQIHLFQVDDERLDGIVEVTAAHELLHAAWARSPQAERDDLISKLEDLYEKRVESDPDLKERMQVYEHLSRASFANELHSVLATEEAELPTWLEKHYAKWFEDRGKLLQYFNHYHEVFDALQQQADILQKQMRELRDEVERGSARYQHDVEQFNKDFRELNRRNDNYEFSDNPEEFERITEQLRERREDLIARHAQFEKDAEEYEAMRDNLQGLSDLSIELDKKLDSDLAPLTETNPAE